MPTALVLQAVLIPIACHALNDCPGIVTTPLDVLKVSEGKAMDFQYFMHKHINRNQLSGTCLPQPCHIVTCLPIACDAPSDSPDDPGCLWPVQQPG